MLNLSGWIMRCRLVDIQVEVEQNVAAASSGELARTSAGLLLYASGAKSDVKFRMNTSPGSIIPNNNIRRSFRA